MTDFLRDFKRVCPILFAGNSDSLWLKVRMWLVVKLLPDDVSLFFSMVISKLQLEYEKLDREKIDKISSLKIEFEYRE